MCQGNGAAPDEWTVISIVILGAHKRKGHGAKFVCPVSLTKGDLSAILFVGDTDVVHLDMEQVETATEAHCKIQGSVTSWGTLLMTGGNALKPIKCFFCLIAFQWDAQGRWRYAANENKEEFALEVPTLDDSFAAIEYLGVSTARETFGVFVCPNGAADEQLKSIKLNAQDWIDMAKESHVRRRDVWFLVDHQLWLKLSYGICSVEAP